MNGWYVDPVAVSPIVMEASTQEDKKYMRAMDKNDIHQINGTLIQGLYGTILERKDCDFGDIPDSKGDITKVKYMKSTSESLEILNELMVKNGIPTNEVDIINEAIANLKRFKPSFENAFAIKQNYLILAYNTFIMAVIDSTSMLIAKYMDYLLGPEQSRYDSMKSHPDKGRGIISLDTLKRFNDEVKMGHFEATCDYLLKAQRSNFTGTGVVIAGATITALISIIPLTRELIYFYYRSRVKLSDYMNQQADFLELNELGVKASGKSAQEQKKILKEQGKIILKLRKNADKLKINNEDIGDLAKKQLADDNRGFSLKNIEKTMYTNKMDGVGLSIV